MSTKSHDSIPSRRATSTPASSTEEGDAPAKDEDEAKDEAEAKGKARAKTKVLDPNDLSGEYRVRDGYMIAHGEHNNIGHHEMAKGGDLIFLSHEDALAVIRNTQHQKDAEGRPNGPAIETKAAYEARVTAQREHDAFMKALAEQGPLLQPK